MINLIERFENFLLALCTLSDNSFLKLFITYVIFMLIFIFFTVNIEKYLGFETKVRLYDLIFMFLMFCMFAWNSYLLHTVKVQTGTPSYQIKKHIPGEN